MGKQSREEASILLRAGFGAGEVDGLFRMYGDALCKRKRAFGVYWHSYALSVEEAKEEAEYCLETIEEYPITGPVWFVYDESSFRYGASKGISVTPEILKKMVEAFCQKMAENGYLARERILFTMLATWSIIGAWKI